MGSSVKQVRSNSRRAYATMAAETLVAYQRIGRENMPTPRDRQERLLVAMRELEVEFTDPPTALADLLADLIHLVRSKAWPGDDDFDHYVRRAAGYVEEE